MNETKTKPRCSCEIIPASQLERLNSSEFGIPALREFPMHDAAHVRSAEAYFRYAPDDKKPELAYRILLKAKKFGVDVESPVIREWAAKY